MASNKNQHFVPRCYLRPFTLDSENLAINIFNIDRQRLIERAPVKHQCSGDYFYGQDPDLEKAIQATETSYAAALREILSPGYRLTDPHRTLLRRFWLFQHLRTESASMRSVEMAEATEAVIGANGSAFRLGIKEAVQMAMQTFAEEMFVVDDLKVCLLRNRTRTPFVTSDDPALLTNRWHLESARTKGVGFGLHSSGTLTILPLSPDTFCLGYDGDVYSVPHESGWVDVRNDHDVDAFNQHQLMNCRANIFLRDSAHAQLVHDAFARIKSLRPKVRHKINYAVLDRTVGNSTRYRVVDRAEAGDHDQALIHTQAIHARPASWPRQIARRTTGSVFTDGTGVGYVRREYAERNPDQPFRRVSITSTQ